MTILFYYFIAFVLGIILGIPIFKFSIGRQNLVLFVFSIPYLLLLLISIPQYSQEIETARIYYFWWIMGVLLTSAFKEYKLKKSPR
jgi:hypothetical protein